MGVNWSEKCCVHLYCARILCRLCFLAWSRAAPFSWQAGAVINPVVRNETRDVLCFRLHPKLSHTKGKNSPNDDPWVKGHGGGLREFYAAPYQQCFVVSSFLPLKPVSLWWIFDFILFFVVSFRFVFVLSIRDCFSSKSGRFLLLLLVFSPSVLNHARFETLDSFPIQISFFPAWIPNSASLETPLLLRFCATTEKKTPSNYNESMFFLAMVDCFNNGNIFPSNRVSHTLCNLRTNCTWN